MLLHNYHFGGIKMKSIVIETKNKGKIIELKKALEGLNISILSLSDFPECPDSPETGQTFEENASQKAIYYSKYTGYPCLADDSGLEVEALNGAPGIYSARYAGEDATDEKNNSKLLDELLNVPIENRKGRFYCSLAFANQDKVLNIFSGICEGIIQLGSQGNGGFGYDPLFYIPELQKTIAELSVEDKQRISHRGKAFSLWKDWFIKNKTII